MTPGRAIHRMLLSAVVILTSSCIDTREEYWLDANGGGRAHAVYELPLAVARAQGGPEGIKNQIDGFLKNTPEIRSSDCSVTIEGERLRVELHAAFDSALDLKEVATGGSIQNLPSAASHLAGEITADLHGRSLVFSRKISAAKALPGAAFLPASQLDGHRMVYIMHLPAPAEESNATRTEDTGRTLVWDIPVSQAVRAPLVTRFKMAIPIPWAWVTGVAVPCSLVGLLAFAKIRKSRKVRSDGMVKK